MPNTNGVIEGWSDVSFMRGCVCQFRVKANEFLCLIVVVAVCSRLLFLFLDFSTSEGEQERERIGRCERDWHIVLKTRVRKVSRGKCVVRNEFNEARVNRTEAMFLRNCYVRASRVENAILILNEVYGGWRKRYRRPMNSLLSVRETVVQLSNLSFDTLKCSTAIRARRHRVLNYYIEPSVVVLQHCARPNLDVANQMCSVCQTEKRSCSWYIGNANVVQRETD